MFLEANRLHSYTYTLILDFDWERKTCDNGPVSLQHIVIV